MQGKGIVLLLIIFIVGGVCLAELQLNDLTQESEFIRTVNIRLESPNDAVAIYLLGERIEIKDYVSELYKTISSFYLRGLAIE